MNWIQILIVVLMNSIILSSSATERSSIHEDLSQLISKEQFSSYKNVADFIDDSPKVTVLVEPEASDIAEYGKGVMKSLTGSDCDRDGIMDDNATCNRVYLKLWLKYER